MTRVLILTAILVMCLACGETETPIPTKPEPVVQSETEIPIHYEIPAHIPHALAERYADVQSDMTEPEFQAFLQYIYDFCQGEFHHTVIDVHLKRAVSEGAYNRAKDVPHPAATYDDRSRIVVASWFKDRSVKVAFDPDPTGLKVVYWRARHIILIELYDEEGGRGWLVSNGPRGGLRVDFHEPKHKAVLGQIIGDWVEKGEVNTPDVPDKHTREHTAYIVIDKADGLSVEPKYKDWIVHFDDAPRTIDEQLAIYNRHFSPDTYDCVEVHPPSS